MDWRNLKIFSKKYIFIHKEPFALSKVKQYRTADVLMKVMFSNEYDCTKKL